MMYQIDPTTGRKVNPLTKHEDKLKRIQQCIDNLPWPEDSNPEKWDPTCTNPEFANKIRAILSKTTNERSSLIQSRIHQAAGLRIKNLDSMQHKLVIQQYSNKNKSGTNRLHPQQPPPPPTTDLKPKGLNLRRFQRHSLPIGTIPPAMPIGLCYSRPSLAVPPLDKPQFNKTVHFLENRPLHVAVQTPHLHVA